MVQCLVCRESEAKYKCPACGMQTCSLPCVKRHKMESSCSGKRPRSEQVPIRQFNDDVLHKGMLYS